MASATRAVIMMRAAAVTAGEVHLGSQPIPSLKTGEVLVRVFASSINRADLLQRRGLYPPPAGESDILGLEAAGRVEELGSNCHKVRAGDRVMALLAGGGNAEFVTTPETNLMFIPQQMAWTQAAAIPEAWLTAFQLLFVLAKIKPAETVLIHAAASGVGTAAVQLVTRIAKGTIFATVGSTEKAKFVRELGAQNVINYKDEDFAEKITLATNGKGVDIILDCVGGSYWEKNMQSIAEGGRWILYGLLGGGKISGDFFAKLLRKRVRLEATTLRARSIEYKAQLVSDFTSEILPHFQTNSLTPVVDSVFPFGKIADAHRYVEENRNTGKVVLLIQDEDRKHHEEF